MALKEGIEQKIAEKPHSKELFALWKRVCDAYEDGGSKAVKEALDTLRDEVANEEEK